MAVAFRGAGTIGANTGTTTTPGVPASVASGDLMLMWGMVASGAEGITGSETFSLSANGTNWTHLGTWHHPGGDMYCAVWWGIRGVVSSSMPTISASVDDTAIYSHACAWSGSNLAVEGFVTDAGDPDEDPTAPSVTMSGTNRTVVHCYLGENDNTMGSPSNSFTQRSEVTSTTGEDTRIKWADRSFASAGSSGTSTVSFDEVWSSFGVAIYESVTTVTGSFTGTDGADAASISGDVYVQGTVSGTDGADIAAVAGDVLVQGSLSGTDGADAASFTGTVAFAAIAGTLSGTDGADSAEFSGDVVVRGGLSGTDGADSASLTGLVLVQGTLAATDGADDASFLGEGATPPITGALDATDGADGASLSGTVSGGEQPPVTTAGGRIPAGTQYRHTTISRELREQEREAKRAARVIAKQAVAAVRQKDWFAELSAPAQAIQFIKVEAARVVEPETLVDPQFIRIAVARLIAEAEQRWMEEQDDDFLLLAS